MNKHYSCLWLNYFEDELGYALRPIELADSELIRNLRNAQMDVLRQQQEITEEEQHIYFNTVIAPLKKEEKPQQILFAFCFKSQLIGYGGLTYIDWKSYRAEVSFLLDPQHIEDASVYAFEFKRFLNLLSYVFFSCLSFHRLFAETFEFRKEHMQVLEEFGFKLEGVLRDHIFKKQQWFDSYMHGLLANDSRIQYPLIQTNDF